MLKGLSGEARCSDGACGDENSSSGKYAGGAGVSLDRVEGNDETIGGEFLYLDFVAVETPAFGFFKTGV